ncbi:MAG: hypothetical protein GY858_09310 [Candidatus Omnitrophica bacterium]|nr:hypothetical protein [Candidatus Omnitrophota bacterium]
MLKREQILMTDWLSEWFHHCAKKYDISYSELIRITLCLQVGEWVSKEYPEYEFDFSERKMTKEFNKLLKTKRFEEELHRSFSKLYFEARKAVDFLEAQEKKKNRPAKEK